MTTSWSPAELDLLGSSPELEISTYRADGRLRPWVPIWVVRVDQQLYVRTRHRRDTGWFGHAVRSRRARVRVADAEKDVAVDDLGSDSGVLDARVDAAFVQKYGRPDASSVSEMVTPAARAATLRLGGR